MKLYACCFCESEMKSQILAQDDEEPCCYNRNEVSACVELAEYKDTFHAFFSLFKDADSNNGRSLISIIEEDWRFLNPSLQEKHKFLNELLSELNFCYTCDSRVTYLDEITSHLDSWLKLKEDLQERRRYIPEFSLAGQEWATFSNSTIYLRPGTSLYRARKNTEDRRNEPYAPSEMGPPDKTQATDGRANPKGIPFLYLCRDEETTAYEIRSLLLDRVTVGRFEILKKLTIIDFAKKPDPFICETSAGMAILAKETLLLRDINKDMSRPVRRDSNNLEYIPTQYICEYIRHKVKADGVQFGSSIRDTGKNVVLFEHQNKVRCTEVKLYEVKQTHISWSTVHPKS